MVTKNKIISEGKIDRWLKKWCKERGHRLVKFNPSGYNGMTDRILMTVTGIVWFIELKSEGRTLRPTQEAWKNWFIGHNHNYLFIDHIDDEITAILENIIK